MKTLPAGSRRWAVPAVVAAAVAVAGGAGGTILSASADPELPDRTAAQLLADLASSHVTGMSGTVVQKTDLGLPALPTTGGQGSSDLSSLVSGSHTLRLWLAGDDRARVALLGTLGESDVIRDGRNVWIWSSRDDSATHTVLPDGSRAGAHPKAPHAMPPGAVPGTPQDAAQRALDALDPSTAVTTDGTASVAGRAAYELVLTPKDTRSLVGQVRLAIDAQRHVPLRVRVIAKGHTDPAFEVGFTHVSFSVPDDAQFRFTPPPGTTVHDGAVRGHDPSDNPLFGGKPTTVGKGWTAVHVYDHVSLTAASKAGGKARRGPDRGPDLAGMLAELPHVSGTWGSGRLLTSSLFTALLTDDGRLVVGAVPPALVYQAAGHR